MLLDNLKHLGVKEKRKLNISMLFYIKASPTLPTILVVRWNIHETVNNKDSNFCEIPTYLVWGRQLKVGALQWLFSFYHFHCDTASCGALHPSTFCTNTFCTSPICQHNGHKFQQHWHPIHIVLATFTSLSLGLQLKEIDHLCLRFKFRRSGMTLLCCLRQQLCWEMLLIEVLHFSHVAHILLMALLQLLWLAWENRSARFVESWKKLHSLTVFLKHCFNSFSYAHHQLLTTFLS